MRKLGEGREDYLPGDGLDLSPNEVQSVLHLLEGGEQPGRIVVYEDFGFPLAVGFGGGGCGRHDGKQLLSEIQAAPRGPNASGEERVARTLVGRCRGGGRTGGGGAGVYGRRGLVVEHW